MHTRFLSSSSLGLALLLCGAAHASPTVYTSSAAFLAALPGAAINANFDGGRPGTVIPSGGSSSGITFSYAFEGASLIVTAGTSGGGGGPFGTISPPLFLGTDDFDALLDGDNLTLGFAASRAIGLYIITAEEPGDTLLDGDIGLSAHGATALLDVDAVHSTLADGSLVYFLGVIDPEASFESAHLGTYGGGEAFSYAIDRIVRTSGDPALVPLPGTVPMLVISLFLLGALWLRRKRGQR